MEKSTIEVGTKNFETLIEKDGIVVLDFWAEWCGPCKTFAPIFEAVAGKNPDITFGKINTEVEQDLSANLGIRSIPTTMIFRDGILLFEQPGLLPEEALSNILGQVKTLDMNKVKEEMDKQDAARMSGEDSDGGSCCGGGCH